MSDPLEGITAGGENVFACPFSARFIALLQTVNQGCAFGHCNVLSNKMLLSCKLVSVSLSESISLIREGFLLYQILILLSSIVNRIFYDVYEPLGLKYFFAG